MTAGVVPPGTDFDAEAAACLDLAVGQAGLTHCPQIHGAHVLLALLQRDGGALDALLRARLRGLRAATLAGALHDRLVVEADLNDWQSGDFPAEGLPRAVDLHPETAALLRRAAGHAGVGARISPLHLARAAFESPDPLVVETLGAAGTVTDLHAMAGELAERARRDEAVRPDTEVFRDGVLQVSAFEPTLAEALELVARVPERPLLDLDVLLALVRSPRSMLTGALARMGLGASEAQATLEAMLPADHATGTALSVIPEARVGRVLKPVLLEAARLADVERATSITEAHLVRAHVARVAGARGSVYERLGVDPARLLAGFPSVPAAGSALFENGRLCRDRFGRVADAALASLARMAPERELRDSDLLLAVLRQPESRLADRLYVLGCPVARIRDTLKQMAAADPVDADARDDVPEPRFGRFLKRVLEEAAALAAREECPVVGESHLIRAHLDCLGDTDGTIYERLGIDARAVRGWLARHPVDREPEAAAPAAHTAGPLVDIAAYLRERVINQPVAVEQATRALMRMRSGLGEPGQVLGQFLFLGPTGVGKTELARAMADVAFGPKPGVTDPYLIKINCGDFQHRWDIVQLLGAAQGLVGYKEGKLTNGLKEKPQAVILFDEAEKADPHIWQSLLPLFDDGIVQEADGTRYDATQCIIIATSNAGYKDAADRLGIWNREWAEVRTDVEAAVWSAVRDYFSPEFLGRFGRDSVVFFNHFSRADFHAIVALQLDRLTRDMKARGIEVTVAGGDDGPVPVLAALAWEGRADGARAVRHLLRQHVRDQIVAARAAEPGRSRFHLIGRSGTRRIVVEPD